MDNISKHEWIAFVTTGPDTDPGILPRSLDVIFSSVGERGFIGMSIKPHCSQEFIRLTAEQQSEEALFKRNLFRQLKEVTPWGNLDNPQELPHICLNAVNNEYFHLNMYR